MNAEASQDIKDRGICTENPFVLSIMTMDENKLKVEVLLDYKFEFTYWSSQTPSNPEDYASSDGDSPFHVNYWPINNTMQAALLPCVSPRGLTCPVGDTVQIM